MRTAKDFFPPGRFLIITLQNNKPNKTKSQIIGKSGSL
jgi:hypothetical protein